MALITYPDKITGDPFSAEEANEIKTVVNSNHNGINDFIQTAVEEELESGAISDALALKAPIASPTFTGTVGGITKSMVGLGSVDNTSDSGKPVSTAQQTALDLKANLASPTFTGTVGGITKTMVGLGSVDNTADTAKPVSTAQQTAIDAKVANNLTASTTVAPSKTAVNTALALKADVGSSGTATNIAATAVGDGVTDDRAAIQGAYDTAYAAGSRLFYLPAGTYLMGTVAATGIYGNLILNPGTVLFGDGDDSIIIRDPADIEGYAITYERTAHNAADLEDRNYTIKNLQIVGATIGRGYESPGATESDGGIFLAVATNRSNRVLIEGVTVDHVNKEAIAVWDAEEITIRNCKVYNCNHDAYNPQLCRSLILTGNYSYGANFAVEYDGRRTSAVPTYALIEGNSFVNTYEYGIGIQAGDAVKISNNLLVGQTGSTTVTFQSIGIYLLPNQGNTDMLEISGNQIVNFIQGGVSNSTPDTSDYVYSRMIIKGNTFLYNGENCVRLKAFSTSKILHTEITGNTCNYWNRIDNGSAHQWSALHIENMDDVSIHGNNFKNVTDGTRNDPLFIKNTSNVRFYDNDCVGPPTAFNSTLDIKTDGTNTGLVAFDNPGLLTVDNRKVWNEVPAGDIDGSNLVYTTANTALVVYSVVVDSAVLSPTTHYTITGTTLTIVGIAPVSQVLISYQK